MTAMPEQAVLTAMGEGGLERGIEAVCELLESLGYIDVARELRFREAEIHQYDELGFF